MMKEQLKEKTKESLASVLPITVIVFLLSATVVPMETGTLLLFLIGAMLLIVGMGIFQLGAELAMTPLGQSIGSRMIKGNKLWATVLICFFMGAIITIAEPDLQVLANQVASIPNNVLIYTVAGGGRHLPGHRVPAHPLSDQPVPDTYCAVYPVVPPLLLCP